MPPSKVFTSLWEADMPRGISKPTGPFPVLAMFSKVGLLGTNTHVRCHLPKQTNKRGKLGERTGPARSDSPHYSSSWNKDAPFFQVQEGHLSRECLRNDLLQRNFRKSLLHLLFLKFLQRKTVSMSRCNILKYVS